jgi:hypothetical protein
MGIFATYAMVDIDYRSKDAFARSHSTIGVANL